MSDRLILVTGSTGYVGGRLVRALVSTNHKVRVLVRDASKITDVTWHDHVEVIEGDAFNVADLRKALAGVHTAYYLLHSLNSGKNFANTEEAMANVFATAAKECEVKQIVYLGGIANDKATSAHLTSRVQVGHTLASLGTPVLEMRAGIIIGSGSASFEMLRHLTERLPIMTTPKWVKNRTHPIAIRDVISYLTQSAELEQPVSGIFDIGGLDVLTYAEMMNTFARVAGLRKRIIIPVPVLSPALSSLWVGLVTPVPASIARPLVGSLINEVVADPAKSIHQIMNPPSDGLHSVDSAIELALARSTEALTYTRWSDATSNASPWEATHTDPSWAGATIYKDVRTLTTTASPEAVWLAVERIGGTHGWYGSDWAWHLRGFLDRLVGGVGLRRGRRNPDHLRVGESLDFWRVEKRVEGEKLRLLAEMKLPGLAHLEFTISKDGERCTLRQEASFLPRGLGGHLYWWIIVPFHGFVFPGMAKNLIRYAESLPKT